MRCPVCRERAPEGANFCPTCGAMLKEGFSFVNEADACEAAAYAVEESVAAREALDSLSDAVLQLSIGEESIVQDDAPVASPDPTTVMYAAMDPTTPIIVRAEPPAAPEVEPCAPIEVAETTVWPATSAFRASDDTRNGDAPSEG